MKKILLLMGATALIAASCGAPAQVPTMLLHSYVGDVKINDAPVNLETLLSNGDMVRTGKDSTCDILFDDKNILRLEENTTIFFFTNASGRMVTMESGAARNVMRNLPKAKDDFSPPFHIETKVAVAAVRGTVFYVRVEDETNTYICSCNGELFVADHGRFMLTNTLTANHHKAIRFSRASNMIYTNDAAMLYHTDADMENTALKIKEKIDWTKIDK